MEVLLGVLWELLEEESKKGVNVLASSDSVADRAAAVRVTDVNWLVKEDDGSICVPRVWVVVDLEVLVNGRRAKLKEQAGKG